MDLVTVVSELEAERTSTLGPRRLPPFHLFLLVLLVIYMGRRRRSQGGADAI